MANDSEKINAKEEISALRTEILESQKARIDLLKFKLTSIAALGSVGLGLAADSHELILCIIPFVCIYIDLLCYHNTMRILVISQFLAYSNDSYEQFLPELGKINGKRNGIRYYFELEDFPLEWSSFLVSIFIAIYGIWFSIGDTNDMLNEKISLSIIIIFSSVLVFWLKNNKSCYHKKFKWMMICLSICFSLLSIYFWFNFGLNQNTILFFVGEISIISVLCSTYVYDKHKENLFGAVEKLSKTST